MRLTTRQQWRELAEMRLKDAQCLVSLRRWSAAYYLAGYAVECGLKAAICKQFRMNAIPDKKMVADIYVHNLNELRKLAVLDVVFDADSQSSPGLVVSWAVVKAWNESARYEKQTSQAAGDMVNAVADPNIGVMTWLRKYY